MDSCPLSSLKLAKNALKYTMGGIRFYDFLVLFWWMMGGWMEGKWWKLMEIDISYMEILWWVIAYIEIYRIWWIGGMMENWYDRNWYFLFGNSFAYIEKWVVTHFRKNNVKLTSIFYKKNILTLQYSQD